MTTHKVISFRIPAALMKKLRERAAALGVTKTKIMQQALEAELDRDSMSSVIRRINQKLDAD